MAREMTPGYERWGEQGSRLIDPKACPDGHPQKTDGTCQRGYSPCGEHGGHESWRCWCGRQMWLREDGAIVDVRPGCVSDR